MGLRSRIKKMKAMATQNYVKKHPDNVIFRFMLQFLNPYYRDVKILIVLLLATSVTNLAYPVGMTFILEAVMNTDLNRLLMIGMIIAVAMFGNFLTKKSYQYNISKLSQYVMRDIRTRLFKQYQDLSLDFYQQYPTGRLISILTNDVGAVQMLISNALIQAIGDIFTIVSSIVLMFVWSWQLSISLLLLAPIFGSIFYLFALKSREYWIQQRQTIAEITRILQESISGSKTIKAFVTEDQNIETFMNANRADREISMSAAKLHAFLQPIMQVIAAAAIGSVLFVGSKLVQSGALNVTVLLGYVILATQFINPFNNLGNLYNQAQQALAAGDRIMTVIETKPNVIDKPNTKTMPPIEGIIEYKDVSFEYDKGVKVLKKINFKSTKNQRVALVGYTGAGKSTFISLLSRFYDPTEGAITIDGYDLREVSLESMRSQMGIVLQDTFLFSGTIMENIRYGKLDATDEECIAAAEKVGAHKFIMNLPENYKTEVRERGSLLSVGQRQLISFARALLANPRILILDEATSSVDPYTELKIQEALEVLLNGRNSFIIAHRLSTILNSDVILVMENGEITQRGTHDELVLQEGGLYKHLYEMQFKKMEEKQTTEHIGS
jgi:ATP-binding cassette subfamily B protein